MGEQRPSDTLVQMANAVIKPRSEEDQEKGIPRFISRPDMVTNGYDARRYLATGSDSQVQTELYEYHWAHLMPGNVLSHLWPLVRQVMLRLPWQIPGQLVPIWASLWLVVVIVAIAVWLIREDLTQLNIDGLLAALGLGGIGLFVTAYAIRWVGRSLSRSFVDVARYVDARPENQKARDDIRRGAITLLQGLHESARYQRIIVIGHSLGSVIGYDAINYLWARMNKQHGQLAPTTHDMMANLEKVGREVKEDRGRLKDYMDAQRELWVEQRLNGNPWLITDFVAVGSPLAHAHVLMVKNKEELDRRIQMLEATSCPPRGENSPDNQWTSVPEWYSYPFEEARILYEAAPFAVVRWHSLFLPKDHFAGPLQPNFGNGVNDVEAVSHDRGTNIPFFAHGKYFRYHDEPVPHDGPVGRLREMLDLDSSAWLAPTEHAPLPHKSTYTYLRASERNDDARTTSG